MDAFQLSRGKGTMVNQDYSFKQDARLILAINKLKYKTEHSDDKISLSLPERKLNIQDVRRILSQNSQKIDETRGLCFSQGNLEEKITISTRISNKIDEILQNIKNAVDNDEKPKLYLRNQSLWSNCIYDFDRVTLKCFADARKSCISYSDREDKRRFNTIIFVLSKVKELLTRKLTVTRRELFYQNVARFRKQSHLDVAVRDVCCLLETPPWQLGIVATAKGLVAGNLTIYLNDGTQVNCMTSGGTIIPQDVAGIQRFKSSAKYIIVVEKDAIFQKLLDEGVLVRLGPVIMLTGKGYPDVCTRLLLTRLVNELELQPLALVDADPHGYEIFLTYKYGSLAQSHLASSLACPSLKLLGTRFRDVLSFAPEDALLPLTALDKRKLGTLLKRPYLDGPIGLEIKKEFQAMLTRGVKAEIESLASTSALCDLYLPAKIIGNEFLG